MRLTDTKVDDIEQTFKDMTSSLALVLVIVIWGSACLEKVRISFNIVSPMSHKTTTY